MKPERRLAPAKQALETTFQSGVLLFGQGARCWKRVVRRESSRETCRSSGY